MRDPRIPSSVVVPEVEGMVLFEVYERGASRPFLVTGDGAEVQSYRLNDGDVVVRRAWATAAPPEFVRSKE